MASIDANLCSLSAEVRSFLSRTIEWPVMNVAADQDSTSNDSVQPKAAACKDHRRPKRTPEHFSWIGRYPRWCSTHHRAKPSKSGWLESASSTISGVFGLP